LYLSKSILRGFSVLDDMRKSYVQQINGINMNILKFKCSKNEAQLIKCAGKLIKKHWEENASTQQITFWCSRQRCFPEGILEYCWNTYLWYLSRWNEATDWQMPNQCIGFYFNSGFRLFICKWLGRRGDETRG